MVSSSIYLLTLILCPSFAVLYFQPNSRWPMDRYPYNRRGSSVRTLFPLYDNYRNPFWGSPDPITPPTTTAAYDDWPCVGEMEAFDQRKGKCFQLATQGGCNKGYWWILGEDSRPLCAKRHCQPFYVREPKTSKCVLMNQAEQQGFCPKGNKFVNNKYGVPRCGCRENHFKKNDDQESVCYPSYAQGPCNAGFYIIFNKIKNRLECRMNPCKEDGLVPTEEGCKRLGDTCGENGHKNVYINPHDGLVGCYDFFRLTV